MKNSNFALRRVTPWVVSGASSIYAIQRARRLSLDKANDESLLEFLISQSDVILLMFGGHVVWHLTAHYRSAEFARLQQLLVTSTTDQTMHQLREVFAVLTLGTGLLARRIANGKTTELLPLIARLQKSVSQGARVVIELSNNAPAVPEWQAPAAEGWPARNGAPHKHDSFPAA